MYIIYYNNTILCTHNTITIFFFCVNIIYIITFSYVDYSLQLRKYNFGVSCG